MVKRVGVDFWVPPGFRQLGPDSFEGAGGLVRIDSIPDGDLVDFAIGGGSTRLWLKDNRVIAETHPIRSTLALVVGDQVSFVGDEFCMSAVRCIYASLEPALRDEALQRMREGATELRREDFTLDIYGHLLFGPLPMPSCWFRLAQERPAAELEQMLFGGGFISFGEPAPKAGFDLLLLPAPVSRSPVARESAERWSGTPLSPVELWGCSAWCGLAASRAVVIFRDPFGYLWRAEYRRGEFDDERWNKVIAFMKESMKECE